MAAEPDFTTTDSVFQVYPCLMNACSSPLFCIRAGRRPPWSEQAVATDRMLWRSKVNHRSQAVAITPWVVVFGLIDSMQHSTRV